MKELKKVFKEMMLLFPGMDIMEMKERNEGRFRFPIYLNEHIRNTEIDVLELSVRSNNCLLRAGIVTIGDFVECIQCEEDLKKIRSCGDKSVKEIMSRMFCYQYETLNDKMKERFVREIICLNQ